MSTVNGDGNGMRSGAQTLLLLASPRTRLLLTSLANGPRPQAELRRVAGFPAQTTLRAQLKRLECIGALERRRSERFPLGMECQLSSAGRELLEVLDVLEEWLAKAPNGRMAAAGADGANAAIRAFVDGWSTTMLRALAAGPRSLTQLDGVIGSLSYPSLERRLAAMRLAGLVARRPGDRDGTPHAVTTWQRLGIAPLLAAVRWENRHLSGRLLVPLTGIDVETAFLLTAPRLQLSDDLSGTCRLSVEVAAGEKQRIAGILIDVGQEGRIASCTTNLSGDPDAGAFGSTPAWLNALIERNLAGLGLGGDRPLARGIVEGLHESLFGVSPSGLDVAQAIRDDGSN